MDVKTIYAQTNTNFNDICTMYLLINRTFIRCRLMQCPPCTKRRGKAFKCLVAVAVGDV